LCRVALEVLVLDEKAEERLERGDGAGLTAERGPPLRLLGQEGAQIRRPHPAKIADPLLAEEAQAGADVALVRRAGQRREAALQPAIGEEVGERFVHRGPPLGRPQPAADAHRTSLRLMNYNGVPSAPDLDVVPNVGLTPVAPVYKSACKRALIVVCLGASGGDRHTCAAQLAGLSRHKPVGTMGAAGSRSESVGGRTATEPAIRGDRGGARPRR
jgi:hypothetical protein